MSGRFRVSSVSLGLGSAVGYPATIPVIPERKRYKWHNLDHKPMLMALLLSSPARENPAIFSSQRPLDLASTQLVAFDCQINAGLSK